jgi:hypothetical protein
LSVTGDLSLGGIDFLIFVHFFFFLMETTHLSHAVLQESTDILKQFKNFASSVLRSSKIVQNYHLFRQSHIIGCTHTFLLSFFSSLRVHTAIISSSSSIALSVHFQMIRRCMTSRRQISRSRRGTGGQPPVPRSTSRRRLIRPCERGLSVGCMYRRCQSLSVKGR